MALLRLGSLGATRVFARDHLSLAKIPHHFGSHPRYCRETVLKILGVPLKNVNVPEAKPPS
jgi:hypothetical protein